VQIIAFGVYDEEQDDFSLDFRNLSGEPPADLVFVEGNAGLGADWPVGVVKSAKALAIAYAVFAAPSTIKENWPIWLEIYQQTTDLISAKLGNYSIDRDTAQMLAMHHAVDVLNLNPNHLETHMAIRHYRLNGHGGYDDLINEERVDLSWPQPSGYGSEDYSIGVRSLQEAAKQASARYIFGIHDGHDLFSIVVEQTGEVSFSKVL